jgi:glycosyltransferase involved in cell wall biosynthesis
MNSSIIDEQSLKEKVRKNKENRISIEPLNNEFLTKDKISISEISYQENNLDIDLSKDPVVACTIVSKNYISQARVLTKSFLQKNPSGKIFVLLADSLQNDIDLSNEDFVLINLKQIGIPNLDSFCFKYSIVELNTGVKAHFLEYLFKKFNLKKLLYLDPDILISNKLDNLWSLLDKKSIVITPHITSPISDNKNPSELDLMKAGNFNLGFIGLHWDSNTESFLNWWKNKLYDFCIMEPEKGFHVDQKWVELAPSLFDNSFILRHPGYNNAYWNLMNRKIETKNNNFFSNDKPAYFFHFSGFIPENIDKISKHQNRFTLKNFPELKPLFEYYRDLLIENGYFETKKLRYSFDYFDNGIKIPTQARIIYRDNSKMHSKFGNPFNTKNHDSFFSFLLKNIDTKKPSIPRIWYQVHKERSDLQTAFPDPLNKNRLEFFNWCINSLQKEYGWSELLVSKIDQNTEDFNTNPTNFSSETSTKGINIAGYFEGEFGIGSSVRYYTEALKKSGIPFVLNNFTSHHHNSNDTTFSEFSDQNPYPVNVIVVNADQTEVFRNSVSPNYFKGKYNIGIWAWELESFPEEFIRNTKYFDEIWAISSFVKDSISKKSPIPTVCVNTPLVLDKSKLISNKEKFGIKNNNFTFLFIFDFLSVFKRKNPLGIIKAFKQVFEDNSNVSLIIKCINNKESPSDFKQLKNESSENIHLMTDTISKDDLLSLIASCDCYVSLHRSEGFGLTIAEAMCAGKPVIATYYGGNTDFMSEKNSFPVKYNLIKVEENYGAYQKGNVWANPDLKQASELMKKVYENQEYAKSIGKKAQSDIDEILSPEKIGKQISQRINEILNQEKTVLHS